MGMATCLKQTCDTTKVYMDRAEVAAGIAGPGVIPPWHAYDALDSDDGTIALSAKQGKALKALIDALTADIAALQTALNNKADLNGATAQDFNAKVLTVKDIIITG